MISKYAQQRLGNVLKAGLLGAVFTSIPVSLNEKFEFYYPLIGFLSGSLTGVFELFLFRDRLRKVNFWVRLLLKSLSYTITIYIAILFLLLCIYLVTGMVDMQDKIDNLLSGDLFFILGKAYRSAIVFVFLFQLDDLLGDGTFRKYITGKYATPKEQEMIFMFLDIKDSTTVAENLGDIRYYEFVDDFFHDISRPIIETDAEIYKYVGDEVIIMWQVDKGLKKNNCVNLYFMIQDAIEKKRKQYVQKYGIVPVFKAGMHLGQAITAQIGDIRKEIVYNGDVLNTTARLEEICNEYNAELLISEQLKQQLDLEKNYIVDNLGEIQLKGKSQAMHIFSIHRKEN